jgi:formylglycine-generating enzyme required for sulfatase activity
VAARVRGDLGREVDLLRLKQAEDVTAIFLQAHDRGRSLEKRDLPRFFLDDQLRVHFDARTRGRKNLVASDEAWLGFILTEILNVDSLIQVMPGELATYLERKGPPPSASAWAAGLQQASARMRNQAQLGGMSGDLAWIARGLRPGRRSRSRFYLVLTSLAVLSGIAILAGVRAWPVAGSAARDKAPITTAPTAVPARPADLALAHRTSREREESRLPEPPQPKAAPPARKAIASPTRRAIGENPAKIATPASLVPEPVSPQPPKAEPKDDPERVTTRLKVSAPVSVPENAPDPVPSPVPAPPTPTTPLPVLTASWVPDPPARKAVLKLARGTASAELRFLLVSSGTYSMGSQERSAESPVRSIRVDPFYMGQYEVTEAQLRCVLEEAPQDPGPSGEIPAHGITWTRAKSFCTAVKKALGNQVREVRLPWECEWEYVAQMESTSNRARIGDFAWIDEDSAVAGPHPVGTKKPTTLGIFDLFGNVAEWVEDAYSETAYLSENPHGPAYGEEGIVRGGSSISQRLEIRPSARFPVPRDRPHGLVGFRSVVVP